MKLRTVMMGLLGGITFYSCTSIQVATDRDRDANFENYESYELRYNRERDGFVAINDINQKRIEKGLDTELERKGMERAEEPDVIIAYALAIDVNRYYNAQSNYYGTPYWGRRAYYGSNFGTTTITEHEVKSGQLIVEVRDAKTDQLLWYGAGSKTLSNSQKNIEKSINETIEKIMVEFPIDNRIERGVPDEQIVISSK